MMDTDAVESYPAMTMVAAVEDDEDELHLTPLTSVRLMRSIGYVMMVAVLLVYAFLIVCATRRRKKMTDTAVQKGKDKDPSSSFPCEIRVRRVQQDLGVEVALMDAPSPKSSTWSLPIKNRSTWMNKQHGTLATTPSLISPASSGNLTRNTVILECDSFSTQHNHCGALIEALSDCGSASAPSDEGMMILPQQYLQEGHIIPAPSTQGVTIGPKHMLTTPVMTPRKQATLFPPPMHHHNTPRPSPPPSSTRARFFPTRTTRKPTDVPSDEEEEDDNPPSELKIKAQWTSDATAAAIQELISHNV